MFVVGNRLQVSLESAQLVRRSDQAVQVVRWLVALCETCDRVGHAIALSLAGVSVRGMAASRTATSTPSSQSLKQLWADLTPVPGTSQAGGTPFGRCLSTSSFHHWVFGGAVHWWWSIAGVLPQLQNWRCLRQRRLALVLAPARARSHALVGVPKSPCRQWSRWRRWSALTLGCRRRWRLRCTSCTWQ